MSNPVNSDAAEALVYLMRTSGPKCGHFWDCALRAFCSGPLDPQRPLWENGRHAARSDLKLHARDALWYLGA